MNKIALSLKLKKKKNPPLHDWLEEAYHMLACEKLFWQVYKL